MTTLVATVVTFLAISYVLALLIQARRPRPVPLPAPLDLSFVVVIPCLDEEVVIGATIEHLLEQGAASLTALVIDDASSDNTVGVVEQFPTDRVTLLRRHLPAARQGKGQALNEAYRYLLRSGWLMGRSPADVVVVALDADGRLCPNALFNVGAYLRDPKVGAVQVGVRMHNRRTGLLARLQDLEFTVVTHVYQRGRDRLGSCGLGGNGQFTRLAALESLGESPWGECLTEDLELGLRLLMAGWINRFCPTTEVEQQAVTSLGRLVRQRTRWFQGTLQCWRLIPDLLRAPLPGRTTVDTVWLLTSPALVLLTTFSWLSLVLILSAVLSSNPGQVPHALLAHDGRLIVASYLLGFGLSWLFGFIAWLNDRELGLPKAIALGHAFILYVYLWIPAGLAAVVRVVRGQRSWTKTARTSETPRTAYRRA